MRSRVIEFSDCPIGSLEIGIYEFRIPHSAFRIPHLKARTFKYIVFFPPLC